MQKDTTMQWSLNKSDYTDDTKYKVMLQLKKRISQITIQGGENNVGSYQSRL